MTFECPYCRSIAILPSNHVHICASVPSNGGPIDDPCDAMSDDFVMWLWAGVTPRSKSTVWAIIELIHIADNDPHDTWPFYIQWIGRVDRRWAHFTVTPGFDKGYEPPRNFGRFNCRGEYVMPKCDHIFSEWRHHPVYDDFEIPSHIPKPIDIQPIRPKHISKRTCQRCGFVDIDRDGR